MAGAYSNIGLDNIDLTALIYLFNLLYVVYVHIISDHCADTTV